MNIVSSNFIALYNKIYINVNFFQKIKDYFYNADYNTDYNTDYSKYTISEKLLINLDKQVKECEIIGWVTRKHICFKYNDCVYYIKDNDDKNNYKYYWFRSFEDELIFFDKFFNLLKYKEAYEKTLIIK